MKVYTNICTISLMALAAFACSGEGESQSEMDAALDSASQAMDNAGSAVTEMASDSLAVTEEYTGDAAEAAADVADETEDGVEQAGSVSMESAESTMDGAERKAGDMLKAAEEMAGDIPEMKDKATDAVQEKMEPKN